MSVPWWASVVVGGISAIAGVLAIVYPKITLLALAIIAGINLLLLGALMLGNALGGGDDDEPEGGGKTLQIVLGLVGILAGIVVLRRPGESVLVVVVALGAWLTISGIVALVRAVLPRTENRALTALAGVLEGGLGILILALPHVSLRTLATLVGLAFVVRGGVLVVDGWRDRHAHERAPDLEAGVTPHPT